MEEVEFFCNSFDKCWHVNNPDYFVFPKLFWNQGKSTALLKIHTIVSPPLVCLQEYPEPLKGFIYTVYRSNGIDLLLTVVYLFPGDSESQQELEVISPV